MTPGILLTQRFAAGSDMSPPGASEMLRFRSVEGAAHDASVAYFTDAAALPATPERASVRQWACRQVSDSGPSAEVARVLMIVAFDVPAERATMVDRWYDEEHIQLLCRAPGWLRARRYQTVHFSGGLRYTSLALHELRSVSVLDSAERAYARSTAWRAAMQDEPWFVAAGRYVYESVNPNP